MLCSPRGKKTEHSVGTFTKQLFKNAKHILNLQDTLKKKKKGSKLYVAQDCKFPAPDIELIVGNSFLPKDYSLGSLHFGAGSWIEWAEVSVGDF